VDVGLGGKIYFLKNNQKIVRKFVHVPIIRLLNLVMGNALQVHQLWEIDFDADLMFLPPLLNEHESDITHPAHHMGDIDFLYCFSLFSGGQLLPAALDQVLPPLPLRYVTLQVH
jgi:hypothetical protein